MKAIRTGLSFALLLIAVLTMAQPAPPGGPPLVITEIMYNPPEVGVDSLEFIELRNPHPDNQRNVGGYSFTAGVEFTFPLNTVLEPHAYVIVAIDSVAFENTFGMPAFQWTSGALSNNGETLILTNNMDGVIDSVVYDNVAPWPTEADGTGASLVLCNDTLDNSTFDNWTACMTNTGITVNGSILLANPGTDCTITDGIESRNQTTVKVFPNPAKGWVKVTSEKAYGNSDVLLQIINMKGELVQKGTILLQNESIIELDESIGSGLYTISLTGEKLFHRQPLLILE